LVLKVEWKCEVKYLKDRENLKTKKQSLVQIIEKNVVTLSYLPSK